MESHPKGQKKSRKKAPSQTTSPQLQLFSGTPNMKLDFLTNQPGVVLQNLRKKEIDKIINNLKDFAHAGDNSKKYKKVMLAVGSPGTGKTSSIKVALNQFIKQIETTPKQYKEISLVQIFSMNANSFHSCQSIIKQINHPNAIKVIEHKTSNKNAHTVLDIIYIEEIDKFVEKNNENSLEKFMAFLDLQENKQRKNTKVEHLRILIGASNTINIQYSLRKKVNISQQKIQTMIFQPYSSQQVVEILKHKIQVIKLRLGIDIAIRDPLIKYLVTKLGENKKDDARSAIQIAKHIYLYAEDVKDKDGVNCGYKDQQRKLQIGMQTINSIPKIKSMLSNSKVESIEKLPNKQKLVLILLYTYLKKSQDLDMSYQQILRQYNKLYKDLGVISYDDLRTVVDSLQTYNFVLIKTNKTSSSKSKNTNKSNEKATSNVKVVLKLSFTDIETALKDNPALHKYFQGL